MSEDWGILKLQLAALGGLLFLSLGVTWVILYYVRLLDHPNERSSHVLATPKCGGVGIVLSFIAGVYVSQLWQGRYLVPPGVLYSLIIPVLMVASVSLADDVHELSPKFRLFVQIGASMMFYSMVRLSAGSELLQQANVLIEVIVACFCLVWLVGMANAFNFMDGIDGLAAGQGLLVSFFFSVIQFGRGECFIGFVALTLMVGCLGFLAFNFPPAKVFMGDVGSVSIGFILASLALIAFVKDPSLKNLIVMPLLMANFLFDALWTFISRVKTGEPIFRPHRQHLYQKFEACGFSHRTVAMTNYGMVIVQGLLFLLIAEHSILLLILLCGIELLVYYYFIAALIEQDKLCRSGDS